MNTERLSRIRVAIVNADRATIRKLALATNQSREAIEDLGSVSAPLPAEALAIIDQWYARLELRAMFGDSRNGRMLADMAEDIGIPDAARDVFTAGDDSALTGEQQAAARSYLIGEPVKATPRPFGSVTAPLDPTLALRKQALAIINGLGPEGLQAFVDAWSKTKAA